jgi:regulator of protease activity HflC (stomatin/prohibitin superfamily)
MEMTTERPLTGTSGYAAVVVILFGTVLGVAVAAGSNRNAAIAVIGVVIVLVSLLMARGLVMNPPNRAVVATLFGRYIGTLRTEGFSFVNPLAQRRTISLRVHNLDSDTLKVNDAVGNPVEIAAVINWKIRNTAKAVFDVEDYGDFVEIQAEAAVRHVASQYPYDAHGAGELSLRGDADQVTHTLRTELQTRLDIAGVDVLETTLRRLAYAPEIAGEMLRKQQAAAVVAARELMVEGALGMVEAALTNLELAGTVALTQDQRALLVSNLLVVLVSDRGVQPVVNTGT